MEEELLYINKQHLQREEILRWIQELFGEDRMFTKSELIGALLGSQRVVSMTEDVTSCDKAEKMIKNLIKSNSLRHG